MGKRLKYYLGKPGLYKELFADFSMFPMASKNSDMACEGIFDLPKRTGNTEHDWGTSIEPLVQEEDLRWSDVECRFSAMIRAGNENAALTKFNLFKDVLKDNIVNLIIKEHNGSIYQTIFLNRIKPDKEVKLEWINRLQGEAIVEFGFSINYQAESISVSATGSGYKIDTFPVINVGLTVDSIDNALNLGGANSFDITGGQVKFGSRGPVTVILSGSIMAASYGALFSNIKKLRWLLSMPGERVFVFPNTTSFIFYCKDGFKVKTLKKNDGQVSVYIEINMRRI